MAFGKKKLEGEKELVFKPPSPIDPQLVRALENENLDECNLNTNNDIACEICFSSVHT
ncbi:hypothetical protein STEG23_026578, partial [Scotinomys teguina]